MSILNDGAYSSRLNTNNISTINTLAGNLLSRKRKRDVDASIQPTQPAKPARPLASTSTSTSLPRSFVVRSVDNDEPISFHILSTLPRAHLPLSYIDNSTTPTRLFTAHFPQLDNDDAPLVLIARHETRPDEPLYAVERVGSRRHALCTLAPWLKPCDIEALAASTSVATAAPKQKPALGLNGAWWQHSAVQRPTTSALLPMKAPRLSFCRPVEEPLPLLEPEATLALPAVDQTVAPDDENQSAEDVFSRFISHYLDTLYIDKTPLAFFTKGPLSRARAAFTAGHVQGATLSDLVKFFRSLIHSSSTADNKYRDKLPELLKDLPAQRADQDDTPAAKRKRRKKKLKPDKSGMLPDEAEYFAKWWYQDEASAPSDETAEQSLKRKSPQLRSREAFMQVILVLEILSLEATPEFKQALEQAPQTKSKKAGQLRLSLELLVDKLCIWHSLHAADLVGDTPKMDKTAKDGANQLRAFCVEVVIPFYMSRTHEHASFVNMKLGGPGTSTNTRPKPSTHKSTDADYKDKKNRRTLQRVATESLPQSAKTPRSFSRSATDSQVVPIKRETPDVSLGSIPLRRDSQSTQARKSDVLEKSRLRQREVDFGAIAAANEAKAKKKQEVEQKLKDAISTLKKPSRAAVSSEFADALEQRKRMAEGRARPSLSKRTSSAAQVAATPKNGHKTTAIAATPHHIPAPSFVRPASPSSGPSRVPSSNIRPKSLSFAHFPPVNEASDDEDAIPATDNRPRHRNALAETPSKPRVEFAALPGASPDHEDGEPAYVGQDRGDSSPLRESPTLLKTPSKPSRPRFSITPSKPTPPLNLGKAKMRQTVASTPPKTAVAVPSWESGVLLSKARPLEHLRQAVEELEDHDKKRTNDIYDILGWNDELDDD